MPSVQIRILTKAAQLGFNIGLCNVDASIDVSFVCDGLVGIPGDEP